MTDTISFEAPTMTVPEMDALAAEAVYQAIQNASNGTSRSQQQQDFRLGMSNIGHCRMHALLLMKQTPPTEQRDKTAAFIGTVLGEAIEAQLKREHPDWLFQHETVFSIPSGGEVNGHPDVVIPATSGATLDDFLASRAEGYEGEPLFLQGIWDLKSKAELESVRKYGQSQQQTFQLTGYAKAMIDEGALDPDKPIWIGDIYFDRSGRVHEAYAIGHLYDPEVVGHIDEWINDIKYALINGEDASRDMPREWCWSWCDYATACRGNDTDVEGLIEDPEFIAAVDMHVEAMALEKRAKKLKDDAKTALAGRSGSTGSHNVRWVDVNAVDMKAYTRSGYTKLDIRPIGKPKGK